MGQLTKFHTENDDHSETHPCFEPIVWTNGTNKDNQPDLADLQEKCKQGQTIQHKVKLLDQMFQGYANITGMSLYLTGLVFRCQEFHDITFGTRGS